MALSTCRRTRGFTLVELSIVLVILGLLVGGVLSGQSLIRAAELRSVMAETDRYRTAVMSFRDKYFALPGDMTNATRFWGAVSTSNGGTGADCYTVASTGTATCNGNGNGYIRDPAGATGIWTFGERWHAWKQLANAKLIEGSYTGVTDSTTDAQGETGGVNVPMSKMSKNIWLLVAVDTQMIGNADLYDARAGNILHLQQTPNLWSSLKPEEMWNLDMKVDDGRPATGFVQSAKQSSVTFGRNCTTSDDATAEYAVQLNANCHVRIYID